MRLNLRTESGPAARLSDDDPLPPDGRAPSIAIGVDALYRSQAARLVRSIARRAGSPDDALDLLHDAFVRFLRLGSGRVRSLQVERPEAYLTRTVTNLVRDRARTSVRRSADRHDSADDHILIAPDAHRLLETRDMLRHLESAMLKLRPRTRQIFLAHRLDGLSYAEIAERTGMSIKGVEKQMSRAIATIDRLMERKRR